MFYQLSLQQWVAKLNYWADKLYDATQITFCYPTAEVKEMEEKQCYPAEELLINTSKATC